MFCLLSTLPAVAIFSLVVSGPKNTSWYGKMVRRKKYAIEKIYLFKKGASSTRLIKVISMASVLSWTFSSTNCQRSIDKKNAYFLYVLTKYWSCFKSYRSKTIHKLLQYVSILVHNCTHIAIGCSWTYKCRMKAAA